MSVDSLISICFLILILLTGPIRDYYQYRKRRTMGQLLFQFSTPKAYKMLFGFAIVFCIGAVLASIILLIRSGWQSSSMLWPVIWSIIFLFCMYSISRFEIRETGICFQGKLTKWEALTTFQWKETGDYKFGFGKEAYILGLNKSDDKFPWWLECNKFQRNQREDVDKLLSQYLPKAT